MMTRPLLKRGDPSRAAVVEIVAHKGDHIVCRAGIEQFQRQRQIGRERAAAPGVERIAVAGDETDLGLLAGDSGGSSIPISAATSRINSASPPDEVMTASRRPAGRSARIVVSRCAAGYESGSGKGTARSLERHWRPNRGVLLGFVQ